MNNLRRIRILALFLGCTLLLFGCGGQITTTTLPISPSEAPTVATDESSNANNDLDIEVVRSLDPEILKDYVFYHGIATVMEDQYWKSKFDDGSHGEGDAVLTSEDYLVFDPVSRKLYIVARNLTYNSKHTVTVNDMNGNYINTANISATGELQEFYSWGFVFDNTINFSALPIRIEAETSSVYTRPETRHPYWVAYTSTADTIKLGRDRVMPPDIAPSTVALNLPLLERIADEKKYGNKDLYSYEATNRLWNIKGAFDYQYQKITYEEMLEGVNAILEAESTDQSFSKRAEALPDVWQASAQLFDQLTALNDASASGYDYMLAIDSIESANKDRANLVIETLNQQNDITASRKLLNDLVGERADQSVQRNLKTFVMDSGDPKLLESFGPYIETINTIFSRYSQLQKELENSFRSITTENLRAELDNLIITTKRMKEASDNMLELFELAEEHLTRALEANPIAELDTLYREWPIIFHAIDGRQTQVDMDGALALPLGYPKDTAPIMPDSTIVLVDIIPATSSTVEGYMISTKSSATEADIVTYYTSILKGYSDFEKMSVAGMQIINAQKKPYLITIMVTENTLGGTEPYLVQITVVDMDE